MTPSLDNPARSAKSCVGRSSRRNTHGARQDFSKKGGFGVWCVGDEGGVWRESSGLSWCSGGSSMLPGCWLPDSAAPATRVRMWGPEMPHRQSTTAQRPPKRSAGDLKSTCGPWNACDFWSCIIKPQRAKASNPQSKGQDITSLHALRPPPSQSSNCPVAAIPEPSPLQSCRKSDQPPTTRTRGSWS